ncbi:hypothetical protein D3C76_1603270 [compost metagenome]
MTGKPAITLSAKDDGFPFFELMFFAGKADMGGDIVHEDCDFALQADAGIA